MRISDWSSDVCSSDLTAPPRLPWTLRGGRVFLSRPARAHAAACGGAGEDAVFAGRARQGDPFAKAAEGGREPVKTAGDIGAEMIMTVIPNAHELLVLHRSFPFAWVQPRCSLARSEEHTSELQSLMSISDAVF